MLFDSTSYTTETIMSLTSCMVGEKQIWLPCKISSISILGNFLLSAKTSTYPRMLLVKRFLS